MFRILARRLVRPLLCTSLLLAGAAVSPAAAAGNASQGAVQVRRIPFSDWLDAQTTALVAWVARANSKPNSDLTNLGVVDYAGKLAANRSLDFGFSADGNVNVRKFEDGSGVVQVNFNFDNAVTYVRDANSALIFGFTFPQLSAHEGEPALSSGHFQIEYAVTDADNAELNLYEVFFNSAGDVRQLKFMSTGRGTCHAALGVPEGTPGQSIFANVGLFTHEGGALADGYPAERVDVRPAGHAAVSTGTTSVSGSPAPGDETAGSVRTGTTWARLKKLYR